MNAGKRVSEGGRLFRFCCVGVTATLTYYCIAISLEYLTVLPVMLINTFSYACGFVASYLGQKIITFNDTRSHARALPRFILASGTGLLINSAAVLAGRWVGFSYPLSSFIAIVMQSVILFLIMKKLVFKYD